MFKINKKIEYALIALKHMYHKHPGQLTAAKEVAAQYRTSFDTTSRVMQIMASKGLLKSEQGAQGGYQITRDLAKISFLELTEMIEGSVTMANCLHEDGDKCQMLERCNIVSPISWLNTKLKEFYAGLSIKELIDTKDQMGGMSVSQSEQEFVV